VLLIAGDGAFGLNGMDLETCVRFGAPVVCVVGNDGGWGQIRNPQLSFFGAERVVATSLPTTRHDGIVEALGGRGALVTKPADICPALERALASGEVWCVNVVLDPSAFRRYIGAPKWPPITPSARAAPAEPWRRSAPLGVSGGPRAGPEPAW